MRGEGKTTVEARHQDGDRAFLFTLYVLIVTVGPAVALALLLAILQRGAP